LPRQARAQVFRTATQIHHLPASVPNSTASSSTLAHKTAVLVFIENPRGELLLLLRAKPPNLGVWSPPGGKVETALGESPFECAARETREETGVAATSEDFHLFAMISEKAYEGEAHWLLFLFRLKKTVTALPPAMAEGRFGFFARTAIDALPIPDTDRAALWPIYDQHREGFVALRADCAPGAPLKLTFEQITPTPDENRPRANSA
jgi:8-oxo-dGTP diphosphatase